MNTSSPDSPTCMNRAYRGCPEGPVGRSVQPCHHCNGTGALETTPAGQGHSDDLAEFEPCYICGGTRQVTVVGLPEVKPELIKIRKTEGWRAA